LACVKLPRVLEWAERLRANQARAGVGLGACRLVIERRASASKALWCTIKGILIARLCSEILLYVRMQA
jgi:hypothetical protein